MGSLPQRKMRVALTVAGSDSGGGAGIQADLATFRALGVWGASAITCLTAQNPDEVTRIDPVDPGMVAEQIKTVARRFPVAAIKVGMIFSAPIAVAVAEAILEHLTTTPLVLDPVMRATSGAPLLKDEDEQALIRELLPLALVVTPNLAEASALAGMAEITTVTGMEEAARIIAEKTPGAVLVKGGHLDQEATDVLYLRGKIVHITGKRLAAPFTHGTGCTLSSAIAAGLARGLDLISAVRLAKQYVTAVLQNAVVLGDKNLGGLGFWSAAVREDD